MLRGQILKIACLFRRHDEGKKPTNVFSLKMPFQKSSETEPNCLCEEVGTLSESTVVSAV